MNTRRFRNRYRSEIVATVRWLGWVMLMMFVLIQTITGANFPEGIFYRLILPDG